MYGGGTVAVFVITVISLCGLLIVNLRTTDVYYHLINTMLGLAIGTLVGDAMLHLIPHVRGETSCEYVFRFSEVAGEMRARAL